MISELQQIWGPMGQRRESRGKNPLVGENLICDEGGLSNHWGKCGIFDK